jgi:hypothetical protein
MKGEDTAYAAVVTTALGAVQSVARHSVTEDGGRKRVPVLDVARMTHVAAS